MLDLICYFLFLFAFKHGLHHFSHAFFYTSVIIQWRVLTYWPSYIKVVTFFFLGSVVLHTVLFHFLRTVFGGRPPQRQIYNYTRKVIILTVLYAHPWAEHQVDMWLLQLNAAITILFSKTPHKLIKINSFSAFWFNAEYSQTWQSLLCHCRLQIPHSFSTWVRKLLVLRRPVQMKSGPGEGLQDLRLVLHSLALGH